MTPEQPSPALPPQAFGVRRGHTDELVGVMAVGALGMHQVTGTGADAAL